MENSNILITKASGQQEYFSKEKLRHSLEKAGANSQIANRILSEVQARLVTGTSTKKIYQQAFNLLKKYSRPVAAKYKLKQAIMELGPTGFPFERYISEILRFQEYCVKVGVIVQGNCVLHEIDVVAEKDDQHFMIECKFHNQPGIKSNVKVPLYVHSRFQDVARHWKKMPGHSTKFHQGWVVTNTKFTTDAIQYGTCADLHLVGWDYPKRGSLKQRIDISGLHPITCLTTLTKSEKQQLLDHKVVLCKELCNDPGLLRRINVKQSKIKNILKEAERICFEMVEQ
jgi:hypothetical protein